MNKLDGSFYIKFHHSQIELYMFLNCVKKMQIIGHDSTVLAKHLITISYKDPVSTSRFHSILLQH